MPKKADLKIVKPEPVEKALPNGEEWNGLDWEDWYDDDRLAREWEERMNGPKKPIVHKKEITQKLPHTFTEAERAKMADEMAELVEERMDAKKAKKQYEKHYKAIIDDADERIEAMAERLNGGQEFREVRCLEIIKYDEGFVEIVRLDTGDIIGTRIIHDDERQMPLVA